MPRKRRGRGGRGGREEPVPVEVAVESEESEDQVPVEEMASVPESSAAAEPEESWVDLEDDSGFQSQTGLYSAAHEARISEGVKSAMLLNSKSTELATSYLKQFGPTCQILESYNHFINVELPAIVTEIGNFEYEKVVNGSTGSKMIHSVQIDLVSVENGPIVKDSLSAEGFVLYPNEARVRGLTYSRPFHGTFTHRVYQVDAGGSRFLQRQGTERVKLGDIPVMVKSSQCSLFCLNKKALMAKGEDPDDPGGYFIINGKEKVIMAQERIAFNEVFVFAPLNILPLRAEIRSTTGHPGDGNSLLYITFADKEGRRGVVGLNDAMLKMMKLKPSLRKQLSQRDPGLLVGHVALKKSIPLLILFKALGFLQDGEIWSLLGIPKDRLSQFEHVLRTTMSNSEAASISSQNEALAFIGQTRKVLTSEVYNRNPSYNGEDEEEPVRPREFVNDEYITRGMSFLNEQVLPHVGLGHKDSDNEKKAFHIGYMVNRLVSAHLGLIPFDDRDHMQHKRYDLPGPLLASLTKKILNNMMDNLRRGLMIRVDKGIEFDFFQKISESSTLTNAYNYAFTSGNWGVRASQSGSKVGVCQPLNRLNTIATLGFLRRMNAPINRLSRMVAPRQVQGTAFGYICPTDTPEGEAVGFLRSQSILSQISVDADEFSVKESIQQGIPIHELSMQNADRLSSETKIFLNASLLGTIPGGVEGTINALRFLKKCRAAWDETIHTKYLECKNMLLAKVMRMASQIGMSNIKGLTKQQHANVKKFSGYKSMINRQASISYNYEMQEIHIRTDAGRVIRPLLVVENNLAKLKEEHIQQLLNDGNRSLGWDDLFRERVVEFLDPAEEECSLIAMFPKNLLPKDPIGVFGLWLPEYRAVMYTHLELEPFGILGVSASLIPFLGHNSAPRLTFQTNMSKQAVGVYALNYQQRFDTAESHVLCYGQKPIVTVKAAAEFSNFDESASGVNAIVAIQSFTGYNQEDSLILNSASLDRGLFRSLHFKVKVDTAERNQDISRNKNVDYEVFERPTPAETGSARGSRNQHLDSDGFPHIGSEIKDGSAVIGKTRRVEKHVIQEQIQNGQRSYPKSDASTYYSAPSYASSYFGNEEPGPKDPINPCRTLVDHVTVYDNDQGYRSCKVRLRSMRIPQMGDKFASRHGQKGVVGICLPETDLPFTKQGIIPDIIINPHAFPGRMTIGHMLEMIDAKVAALQGKRTDRPAFSTQRDLDGKNGVDVCQELGDELEKLGFSRQGFETLYHGAEGYKINTQIFIGPCFYQRLKHMTEDKLRFRARGPVNILLRQPQPKQSQQGGLRVGEMERDSLIAHGGGALLRERLLLVSDYYRLPFCHACGNILIKRRKAWAIKPNGEITYFLCPNCRSGNVQGFYTEIPYAFKLLVQELMTMNIKVALVPDLTESQSAIRSDSDVERIDKKDKPEAPVPANSSVSLVNQIMADMDETTYSDYEDVLDPLKNWSLPPNTNFLNWIYNPQP